MQLPQTIQNGLPWLAGYAVLSAAISSMPTPKTNSSASYCWFYKFANALMANVNAIRGKQQYEEVPPKPDPPAQPPPPVA